MRRLYLAFVCASMLAACNPSSPPDRGAEPAVVQCWLFTRIQGGEAVDIEGAGEDQAPDFTFRIYRSGAYVVRDGREQPVELQSRLKDDKFIYSLIENYGDGDSRLVTFGDDTGLATYIPKLQLQEDEEMGMEIGLCKYSVTKPELDEIIAEAATTFGNET